MRGIGHVCAVPGAQVATKEGETPLSAAGENAPALRAAARGERMDVDS
jgi:hypothetical protein